MHHRTKQDAEQGQALVEFALTIPIFLFMVFGILDLGRLIFAYVQVIDAARQGVRWGIVEGLEHGNFQYLDCAGIDAAARDTPGLVPTDDLEIVIKYYDVSGGSEIADCDYNPPEWDDIQQGATVEVTVIGDIAPMTPVLAMFDNSFEFDYTAERSISSEGVYYTAKWPVAPLSPTNFRAEPVRDGSGLCTGRVAFEWDPMLEWPEKIQIRDANTGAVVQEIISPSVAYCRDNDPAGLCGANIDPDGGSGSWYMIAITDDLASPRSNVDDAECEAGGGPLPPGVAGYATIKGVVFNDRNGNGRQGGPSEGPWTTGFTIRARAAGPNGALYDVDDIIIDKVYDGSGNYSFSNLPVPAVPIPKTSEWFAIEVSAPGGTYVTAGQGEWELAIDEVMTNDIGIGS